MKDHPPRLSAVPQGVPSCENLLDDRRAVPPFAALRAFEAVGRLGGIRGAAQALSIDHTVVSRHVRSLEAWLGVALVDRMRGGSQLTEDGREYHRHISRAINDIAEYTADLIRRGDDKLLRISCIPGFAAEWLAGRLAMFEQQHPDLELELHPTDQQSSFTARGADVDIRFVPDPAPCRDPFLKTFELSRPAFFAVASPSLITTIGAITTAAQILNAPLLHEENADQWSNWLRRQGLETPAVLPGPRLWHAHLAIEAARAGRGLALANALLVQDDLKTGRLVMVGPETSRQTHIGAYVLTCRLDRCNAPQIAAFRRWLQRTVEAYERHEDPPAQAIAS